MHEVLKVIFKEIPFFPNCLKTIVLTSFTRNANTKSAQKCLSSDLSHLFNSTCQLYRRANHKRVTISLCAYSLRHCAAALDSRRSFTVFGTRCCCCCCCSAASAGVVDFLRSAAAAAVLHSSTIQLSCFCCVESSLTDEERERERERGISGASLLCAKLK